MVYIKRMVMHGFKSFAKETEVVFDKGINVIIGPNGSGKSNVSDALCFVLGRLSIKSMRAAKAKNLMFMGSKYVKPAREASVELIFDNSDRGFAIDKDEIILKRIVRINGQSIYKINDEVKTRAEIIELLAQAGIDPHGFNMVLQGEIQSIVRMHPEERRKIIEEVAGIAIYESRKEKSLHELQKTEEKLKEINSVLRERLSFLKNLEKERAQAQKFKEIELTIKRARASIITKKLNEKKKEIESIEKSISSNSDKKSKIKEENDFVQNQIEKTGEKINHINKSIQQATGLEQENLHNQIANLRADLEGLRVRKETYEHRKQEIQRRLDELSKTIPSLENEIKDLKTKSPNMAKKSQGLKKKKEELSGIEEERKGILALKAEYNSTRERIKDKERQLGGLISESDSVLKQIEENSINLVYKTEQECSKAFLTYKTEIANKRKEIEEYSKNEIEHHKLISVSESEIIRLEKIKNDVKNIDICPLCQSKIDSNHINHVFDEANVKIKTNKENIESLKEKIKFIISEKEKIIKSAKDSEDKSRNSEIELVKHKSIKDKKDYLRRILERKNETEREINILEEKRRNLENKTMDLSKIEEKYQTKILEIEELSSSTEEDVDTTLLFRERELENSLGAIKRAKRDLEEMDSIMLETNENFNVKKSSLEELDKKEKELNERFKKMFEERDRMQREIQENNFKMIELQNSIKQIEDQINYLRVGKAKLDAEAEGLELEMKEFIGIELISASLNVLEEKLKHAQDTINTIGSINMRALEVYDEIKKEYDSVQEKVNTLEKEKIDIMGIIEEIDKKKTKSFMKTFKAISDLFSTNFAKLYTKGVAFLELENKEDIFQGGVNIVVRLAKGKYFDVTSLSGGEQTLVALSLLFAIQEHKPYHFYIFDEIDAALDKRNSERLSALLTQYMKSGQYIVITHNDAVIMNSNLLYGVSMQDGVSKVLSLKVN